MDAQAAKDAAHGGDPAARRACSLPLAAWFVLAALVLAVYGRVVGFEFVLYDDPVNIVDNPRLAPPTMDGLAAFWARPYLGLYVPLAYSAWWAAALHGDAPQAWLYHALPLAAHLAAALLLLRFLLRLGCAPLGAWCGAALWALHPLQAETVAWASELRGAAANAFVFLYLERQLAAGPVLRGRVVAHIALVAALLCKPSAAVAPGVACLLDLAADGGGTSFAARLGAALRRHAPALLLACAALALSKLAQADELLRFVPAWHERPLVALDALGHHARAMFAPFGLAPDHGRRPETVLEAGWSAPAPWAGLLCAGLCAWSLLRLVKPAGLSSALDSRAAAAAPLVALCCLAPTLGLLPFAHQSISTVADRYASLALLAPALVAACWVPRARPRAALAAVVALCAACGAAAHAQCGAWRDTRTLFEHTLEVNPGSATAWTNLGLDAERRGDEAEARRCYSRALEARPAHARAHQNLGLLDARAGDLAQAKAHLLAAREYQPYHARHHSNLAAVLAQTGDYPGALDAARRAVELDPELADGHNALGVLAQQRGDHAAARQRFEHAARLRPSEPEYARNAALACERLGDLSAARAWWSRALATRGARPAWRLDAARSWLASPSDPRLALECLEPLVAVPGVPPALVWRAHELRAQARLAAGDAEGARADWQAALQACPVDEPARTRLQQALAR